MTTAFWPLADVTTKMTLVHGRLTAPAVQVSKRSVNFASRRFYLSSSLLVNLQDVPIPAIHSRALARARARFCHAFNALLTAEVQQRLDALFRRGRPEEPIDPNQPLLFPELAQPEPAAPASPAVETEASQPRKGKPHGRRRPARQLRREQRRYELPTLERLCPECGTMRGEIGVETTEQYDYKPAEVFVVEHQRVKYACKCCEGHVAIAPKPPQPLDKGLPGPGLLAQIIVDKYQDHIPLHRTEQRFERLGVKLPRSTMCDWMASAAELLTPLWQLLKHWVLQSKVLHTDDTTVPVRDETKSNHRYGRLWDYIGDQDHPGIVFDYTTTHARDGPAEFLKDFKGFLQADAYGGYDGIYTGSNGAIVEVGCMAHAAQQVQRSGQHRSGTRPGGQGLGAQTLRRRGRGQGHHRRGKADRRRGRCCPLALA